MHMHLPSKEGAEYVKLGPPRKQQQWMANISGKDQHRLWLTHTGTANQTQVTLLPKLKY